MIAMLVSYQLPKDMTRDEVIIAAREVAEDWIKNPKLIRKDFLLDENNMTYGFYLFKDRESAEQSHGDEFLARVRNRFGVEPEMQYFDYLLTADASKGEVVELS